MQHNLVNTLSIHLTFHQSASISLPIWHQMTVKQKKYKSIQSMCLWHSASLHPSDILVYFDKSLIVPLFGDYYKLF